MRKFDLIIYGATGFTGRYVVQRLAETVVKHKLPTQWAVAVRNVPKMREYLEEIEHNTKISGLRNSVTLLEANIDSPASMRNAFQQGKLVMNCIGPYSLLGEPVVKACIDSHTHCMDLSGEPLFLEKMEQKYDKEAAKQQVYVVGSCGFDSIPSDVGVQFLKKKFNGTLDQTEHLLELWYKKNHFSYATWVSLMEGYKHKNDLKQIRNEIFSKYGRFNWKSSQKRHLLRKAPNGYLAPFPGSDRSVVKRTQMYRYSKLGEHPTQFEAYCRIPNSLALFALISMNSSLQFLSQYSWGEKLLRKYSSIFSFGMFKEGQMPDRTSLMENRTRVTLIGRGWSNAIPEHEQTTQNMDKCSAVIMNCGDGAYIETAIISIHTALSLLDSIHKKVPVPYGVITPGSIIDSHDLVSRLNNENVSFEFIEDYKK